MADATRGSQGPVPDPESLEDAAAAKNRPADLIDIALEKIALEKAA
ncbi:hypothetical protein WEB32_27725 [Streptomyces netropsis]